ncbi:hypothetical protein NLJ89_g6222 [Agrocybe chaxingu]|uniref:Transmembrane protein n=1 Tax=Agrocybe chaxingu TaxID=84603 RepID=A0A9W8K5Z7_9AGAR|nr:hypothetical protein NLJ89_g6222 [Agrocybe chaxingu]
MASLVVDPEHFVVTDTLDFRPDTAVRISALHISPNGALFCVLDSSGTLTIYDSVNFAVCLSLTLETFEEARIFHWHPSVDVQYRFLTVSRAGSLLEFMFSMEPEPTVRAISRTDIWTIITDPWDPTPPISLSALNHDATEMAVVGDRRLFVWGDPFEQGFSFASTTEITPPGIQNYDILRNGRVVSVRYVSRHTVLVCLSTGFVSVSTASRSPTIVNSFVAPAGHRTIHELILNPLRNTAITLTGRSGFDLYFGLRGQNIFEEAEPGTEEQHRWFPSFTALDGSPIGPTHSSGTRGTYIGDTLLLGTTTGRLLATSMGSTQVLDLFLRGTDAEDGVMRPVRHVDVNDYRTELAVAAVSSGATNVIAIVRRAADVETAQPSDGKDESLRMAGWQALAAFVCGMGSLYGLLFAFSSLFSA